MRIALIDPPGINKGLNIGLGILSACLNNAGHMVRTFDFNNSHRDIKGRIQEIRGYDLIGISVKSFTAASAARIATSIGRDDLICGGAHISIDGTRFLRENKFFRAGVIGEGEESLLELVEVISSGGSLDAVKGLVWRGKDGEIFSNPARGLISDIDTLPDPEYSSFDSLHGLILDYPVITSRGCPYSCIYCCVGAISGRKMRFRRIERVVSEIECAADKYKSSAFSVLDDNFTLDIKRAKDFCRALIRHNIKMSWSCPNGLRADCLDDELVSLMRDSGCRQVSIGIESLNPQVFDNINKGEDIGQIKAAVKLFNKYKIKVNGFFLIGLPQDTLKRNIEGVKEALSMGLSTAHWSLFVPYPGTKAWEWLKGDAKIISDWKEGFHFGPRPKVTFETGIFKKKDMVLAYKIANIKCRSYSVFWDSNIPLALNVLHIVALIIRYDLSNFHRHAGYLLRNIARLKIAVRDT